MTQQTFDSDIVSESINFIKEHEPPEGYYLAFSGGKDSIVIYDLAVRASVKFDAHFNKTTVDPPLVLEFIRDNYPSVIWEKPKKSMFQIIVDHATPPTRHRRYCCRELKELGGKKRVVMLGIRKAESTKRKNRKPFAESRLDKGKFFCNPILSWKDEDVWEYIDSRKLPYPSLYDLGRTRIGCILCPLQSHNGRVRDLIEFPKFAKAYLLAFKRMLEKIKSEKRTNPLGWETPEDVMDWWINGDQRTKPNKDFVRAKKQHFKKENEELRQKER